MISFNLAFNCMYKYISMGPSSCDDDNDTSYPLTQTSSDNFESIILEESIK